MATDVTQQGLGSSPQRPAGYAGIEPGERFARHDMQRGFDGLETADTLERGLGWFSIALGTAAVVAPRVVSWVCGTRGRAAVAMAAVAGVTALDLLASLRATGSRAVPTVQGVSGRTDIYLER